MACCLKAVCTADGASGIETVRLACGGHGYMECSNLPSTYGMVTAACTYEGENTVLLLQTSRYIYRDIFHFSFMTSQAKLILFLFHVGRYLLKSWDLALQGKPLVPTVAYLSTYVKSKKQKWDSSIPSIIQALEAVAAK